MGGTWGYYVVVPIVRADIRAAGRHQTKTGLGDILFVPAVLTWHTPNLHWVVGVDFTTPTGTYSKRDLANIGRNYFGIMPNFSATWLSDDGFELSARLMYSFNTTNQATGYHSGQEFQVDTFAGYHYGKLVGGLAGYSFLQTTDDSLNGSAVNDARGRALALGPAVAYGFESVKLFGSITHEFVAENRPLADRGLFRMIVGF